jgi:hypothetical protein
MFSSGAVFQLWSFTIPISFLGMALSLVTWYVLIRLQDSKFTSSKDEKWRLSDSFSSLALTGIVLYKFWPVISDPSLIWTRGLAVIYFSGGSYFRVGLLLLIVGWFGWHLRRHRISLHKSGQILIKGFIPALLLWHLLIREYGIRTDLPLGIEYENQFYHPMNFYIVVFLVALIAMMLFLKSKTYPVEPWVMLVLSCFYIVIAPLRVVDDLFIVFKGLQWAWLGAAVGIVWIIVSHQKIDQQRASSS